LFISLSTDQFGVNKQNFISSCGKRQKLSDRGVFSSRKEALIAGEVLRESAILAADLELFL
jgi:hypothetical protein